MSAASGETMMEEEEDDDDDFLNYTILGTSSRDLDCQPHVLSPSNMDALRSHLPFAVQHDNFWLKYSMARDGASMRTLLEKVRSSSRTVMAIETTDGDVFGAFTASPWRSRGRKFYGSCEAFLWRMKKSRYSNCATVEEKIDLERNIDVFPWSGKNRNVQLLSNADGQLMMGCGAADEDDASDQSSGAAGGCGLVLCPDMIHGFSDLCLTFDSPRLPVVNSNKESMFKIANVEVWALTPAHDVQLAEKLEQGRQFVMEWGKFVQE